MRIKIYFDSKKRNKILQLSVMGFNIVPSNQKETYHMFELVTPLSFIIILICDK